MKDSNERISPQVSFIIPFFPSLSRYFISFELLKNKHLCIGRLNSFLSISQDICVNPIAKQMVEQLINFFGVLLSHS